MVDATGKLLDTATIYPHEPHNEWDRLARACSPPWLPSTRCDLIAIGNGTASRETDKLAGELIKQYPDLKLTKVMVSRSRRIGLLGVGTGVARSSRTSTCRCAARCRSPAACRTRWPSW